MVTRLRFGRILNIMPNGINAESLPPDLIEGKFRTYWEAADKYGGNERQRFAGQSTLNTRRQLEVLADYGASRWKL